MGDFGVSVETKDSMMQASTFAGTWNYMAPEMLKGKFKFQSSCGCYCNLFSDKSLIYNAMVDMWALGCTFYEVLHIKPMFSGPVFKLINLIGNGELQAFEADCPSEFKNIIMQCFEAVPENRPTALKFIETADDVRFNMQRVTKTEQARRQYPTKMRYQKFLYSARSK